MATSLTNPTSFAALDGLARMAPWRQIGLLVGVAASVAIGVAAALWMQTPHYVPLGGPLGGSIPAQQMAEVSAVLDQAGIAHRFETGALMVDASSRQAAEFALADLAHTATNATDSVYGEPSLTETRAEKQGRAIHAKQLDLARTIQLMKPIASAKVHLAVARRSPFLPRNRAKSTAAVMVRMHRGHELSATQVESIRQLVAQSVEGLMREDVVVTDHAGRLLGRVGKEEGAEEIAYIKSLETHLTSKISRLLTPITGPNRFTAEVTVDVDFTTFETFSENYNADRPGVRSRSFTEESGGARGLGGIPGALSNQPPGASSVPERVDSATGRDDEGEGASGTAIAATPVTTASPRRRSETVRHELDRNQRFRRASAPKLTHLSAAIVLDDHHIPQADGTTTTRPWTPEELNAIRMQIQSAIGFSTERLDQVTVHNTAFARHPKAEALPAPPIWQSPWLRQLGANLAVLALVVALVFGVVRPLLRALVNRDLAERSDALDDSRLTHDTSEPARQLGSGRQLGGAADFDGKLTALRELIDHDPKRAANVVKQWVGGNA